MKKKQPEKGLVITKGGKDISTVNAHTAIPETIEGERILNPEFDPENPTVTDFLSPLYEVEDDVLEAFLNKTENETPQIASKLGPIRKVYKAKSHYRLMRQKKFLKAYERIGPNISLVCSIAGITRTTFLKWKKDIDFLEALEAVEQSFIDRVEHTMFKVAWDEKNTVKNPVPGIFILKTKAQDRGYIERQDIHQKIDISLNKEQIDAVASAYEKVKNVTPIQKVSSPIKPLPLPGFERDYKAQENED